MSGATVREFVVDIDETSVTDFWHEIEELRRESALMLPDGNPFTVTASSGTLLDVFGF